MYLTKERLEDAGISCARTEKFAKLFPNGTEVTRELCVTHPDVFSFGLPGLPLICEEHSQDYANEIMDIDRAREMRRAISIVSFRQRMYVERDDKNKIAVKIGHDPYNPPKKLVALYSPPRPPTLQEENNHKHDIDCIENEFLLGQALAFYKASRSLREIDAVVELLLARCKVTSQGQPRAG